MNKKVFFNLLLVLTIGFSACNKENDPIDENPYSTLTQSEIVSLLNVSWLKSLNVPEVRQIDTVRNVNDDYVFRNDVRILEINRNQKKSLEVAKNNDGSTRLFFYIENLIRFAYRFEADMSEPTQIRTTLGENFWDIYYYTLTNFGSHGYENYTWSVKGRLFTGIEKREKVNIICTVKLNENEQLISVEHTNDMYVNTGIFIKFSYESINPKFPESFDKDDFIYESE